MNKLFCFSFLVLSSPLLIQAQTTYYNYVANTPNTVYPIQGYNTIVGRGAGVNSSNGTSTGYDNTFIGTYAGSDNNMGYENTFVGKSAGNYNETGNQNAFFGFNAGYSSTTSNNVYIGHKAGQLNSNGSSNVFIGSSAGYYYSSGGANVFVGSNAGYNNKADFNSFVGNEAGFSNTTGNSNAFLGNRAGYANTTGSNNTFLGWNAGYTNKADFNTFVGNEGGYSNTSGTNNSFMGYRTGYANTTGSSNTFLGWRAGRVSTTGSSNTFVGSEAGVSSTTATGNTFVGQQAGYNVTTGSHNIIIGPSSGTAITTSDDNVLMGYNSQADEGVFRGTAIGTDSRVAVSNAVILGNNANVGIGTSAPTARLEVVSETADASGLRLTNLTTSSQPTQLTDQFLTVNEKGDVIKARYQLRISNASEWSDQVFSPTYPLQSLTSVAAYIDQHGHLPGVPSADQVVREGVSLAKLNATLLEKIEELTLYSIQLTNANQKLQDNDRKQQAELDELKQLVKLLADKK